MSADLYDYNNVYTVTKVIYKSRLASVMCVCLDVKHCCFYMGDSPAQDTTSYDYIYCGFTYQLCFLFVIWAVPSGSGNYAGDPNLLRLR